MIAMRDVSFGDQSAWEDFVLKNAIDHTRISAKLSHPIEGVPITDAANINSWLLDHARIHSDELAALGYPQTVDFSNVDLKNKDDFYSWIEAHYFVHMRVSKALNL